MYIYPYIIYKNYIIQLSTYGHHPTLLFGGTVPPTSEWKAATSCGSEVISTWCMKRMQNLYVDILLENLCISNGLSMYIFGIHVYHNIIYIHSYIMIYVVFHDVPFQ